jgi:hypothetical protein
MELFYASSFIMISHSAALWFHPTFPSRFLVLWPFCTYVGVCDWVMRILEALPNGADKTQHTSVTVIEVVPLLRCKYPHCWWLRGGEFRTKPLNRMEWKMRSLKVIFANVLLCFAIKLLHSYNNNFYYKTFGLFYSYIAQYLFLSQGLLMSKIFFTALLSAHTFHN